jgi:DNA-binding LacI/PurR family transcriptional regulator
MQPRAMLRDVAALAGVSRASASMVMRGAPGPSARTRDRVKAAAAELAYRPDPVAQALKRHRSKLLGVVFDARDTFHADLLDALYVSTNAAGYQMSLAARTPSRSTEATVRDLLQARCEGIIMLGTMVDRAVLDDHPVNPAVVVVGQGGHLDWADTVHTADDKGVDQAVVHLTGLGHCQIAHIDGGSQPGAADRRRGYRRAMRRLGLANHEQVVRGDYTEASGTAAVHQWMRDATLPTAVIGGNDRCATGVLDACLRARISVPEQVSVIGYDDSQISRMAHINLTTVAQDTERLAAAAVEATIERLDHDRTTARTITLAPHLVPRGTTALVRAGEHALAGFHRSSCMGSSEVAR